MHRKKNANTKSFMFSVFQNLAMNARKSIRKMVWSSSMITYSSSRSVAVWKLLNEFERVRIEIEFAFHVQAFERNDYIRTFNVFHEIHGWPAAEKDTAGIFKAISVIPPEAFTGR